MLRLVGTLSWRCGVEVGARGGVWVSREFKGVEGRSAWGQGVAFWILEESWIFKK